LEYKDFILDYPDKTPVEFKSDQVIKVAMSRTEIHKALGHPSFELIDNMIRHNKLPMGLTCNSKKVEVCIACREGKNTKKSFPSAIARADELPGEHLYTDINFCSLTSLDGHTMSSITVDAASRYTFNLNHSSKGDSGAYLVKLIHYVERQTGNSLKRLTKDNAMEYHGLLTPYFEKQGVHIDNTIPGLSQQNGIVERKHRTIWAKTRATLLDAKVPLEFWSFAMSYVVYHDNLLPQKALNKISSPYQRFFGREHHGLRLAPFGTLVYVSKTKTELQNRVMATGKVGMFIGYTDDSSNQGPFSSRKGYLIYYHEENTWKEEWHVTFERGVFFTDRFPLHARPTFTMDRNPLDQIWTNREGISTLPPTMLPAVPGPLPPPKPIKIKPTPPNPTQKANLKALEALEKAMGMASNPLAPVSKTFLSLFSPMTIDAACNKDQEEDETVERIYNEVLKSMESFESFEQKYDADPALNEKTDPNDPTYVMHRLFMLAEENASNTTVKTKRKVPKSTREAHTGPDKEFWQAADNAEIDALLSTGTLVLAEDQDPSNKNIVPTKMVRTSKEDINGKEFGKSRLVAKGYAQQYGRDFHETYSPTISDMAMRVIFSLACILGLDSFSYDFVTAFLNAELDNPVYIRAPFGFGQFTGLILKVIRALYGLKQSPRLWSKLLMRILRGVLNLQQSIIEPCLFFEFHKDYIILIFFWVDDLNVFCNNESIVKKLEEYLESKFKIKKLGPIKSFIKLRFDYQPGRYVAIDQERYIVEQIHSLGLVGKIKHEDTPLDQDFYKNVMTKVEPFADLKRLQQLVGVLVYISMRTRPDIITAVGILATKLGNPTIYLLEQCYRVFGYLLRTKEKKLILGTSTSKDIIILSDTDYAGDLTTCHSRGCAVAYVMGGCVHFQSKNLAKKTTSSGESEFFGLHETVGVKQMIVNLLEELTFKPNLPIILADNMSAIMMCKSEGLTDTVKKIATKYQKIRQEVLNKDVILRHVSTENNVADIGTKPLGAILFNKFADQLLDPGQFLDIEGLPSYKDDSLKIVFGDSSTDTV